MKREKCKNKKKKERKKKERKKEKEMTKNQKYESDIYQNSEVYIYQGNLFCYVTCGCELYGIYTAVPDATLIVE